MGYLPSSSIRSRAVHLVSDITTVLLNPISDHPSKPHDDGAGVRSPQKEVAGGCSEVPDGPDTSSFTAFVFSFLSSPDLDRPSKDACNMNGDIRDKPLGSVRSENTGRKSLVSRGKQTLGKAFHKAAKLTGYRQNSELKLDTEVENNLKLIGHESKTLETGKEAAAAAFCVPEMSEPSVLLSEELCGSISVSLPALAKERKWVLLYSTWRHGISLSTLYRRSMLCPGYCLLVVGDHKGAVFGGLVEAPLLATTKRKYQGTNDSFLFTTLSSHLVIFHPTGANRYYTLCSTDFLALGGGGHFGLYLDGDLLTGSSSASETYGNSCLSNTQDFKVKEVELWAFVYASKVDEVIELCRTERPGICRW